MTTDAVRILKKRCGFDTPTTGCYICKKLSYVHFACPVHYLRDDTWGFEWVCFDCTDALNGGDHIIIGGPIWRLYRRLEAWLRAGLSLLR